MKRTVSLVRAGRIVGFFLRFNEICSSCSSLKMIQLGCYNQPLQKKGCYNQLQALLAL
jgi:hypothetical protein